MIYVIVNQTSAMTMTLKNPNMPPPLDYESEIGSVSHVI